MLGWFTGLGTAIKIGIVLAIFASIGGAIWYIHHAIWKEGYNAATLKLQPIIDKQAVDLKNALADIAQAQEINKQFAVELQRLHTLTVEQQVSIDKFKADALAAEIKVRKVLVEIAAKERRYTAEIARLLAIASGPPITEGAYEEADNILRTLVRDRMRNDGGSAPAAGAPPAKGGTH